MAGLKELAMASSHMPNVAHTFQKLKEAGLPVLVIKRDGLSAEPAGDFGFAYQLADDLQVLLAAVRAENLKPVGEGSTIYSRLCRAF